jgi:hypothetical protein
MRNKLIINMYKINDMCCKWIAVDFVHKICRLNIMHVAKFDHMLELINGINI